MNDKNLCYSCARGKVCRENPAFPCKECAGYVAEQKRIHMAITKTMTSSATGCHCQNRLLQCPRKASEKA